MLHQERIIPVFCIVAMLAAVGTTARTVSLRNGRGLSPGDAVATAIDEDDMASFTANLERIDIDGRIVNSCTALMLAVRVKRVEMVRYLLDHRANVNAVDFFGTSALHIAATIGDEQLVDLLLRRGAQVNAKSQQGITPLILAARTTSAGVVKQLLEGGADVGWRSRSGVTALIAARESGNIALVKLLTQRQVVAQTSGK